MGGNFFWEISVTIRGTRSGNSEFGRILGQKLHLTVVQIGSEVVANRGGKEVYVRSEYRT
jgi:NADPH:quinone reductase-like Zn-dependent oxidoreductase